MMTEKKSKDTEFMSMKNSELSKFIIDQVNGLTNQASSISEEYRELSSPKLQDKALNQVTQLSNSLMDLFKLLPNSEHIKKEKLIEIAMAIKILFLKAESILTISKNSSLELKIPNRGNLKLDDCKSFDDFFDYQIVRLLTFKRFLILQERLIRVIGVSGANGILWNQVDVKFCRESCHGGIIFSLNLFKTLVDDIMPDFELFAVAREALLEPISSNQPTISTLHSSISTLASFCFAFAHTWLEHHAPACRSRLTIPATLTLTALMSPTAKTPPDIEATARSVYNNRHACEAALSRLLADAGQEPELEFRLVLFADVVQYQWPFRQVIDDQESAKGMFAKVFYLLFSSKELMSILKAVSELINEQRPDKEWSASVLRYLSLCDGISKCFLAIANSIEDLSDYGLSSMK